MEITYKWAQQPPVSLNRMASEFPLARPLSVLRCSQGFGENLHPADIYRKLGMLGHHGRDYACRNGTELFAACDGTITYAKPSNADGYGISVGITSDKKEVDGVVCSLFVIYGHMQKLVVESGQRVKRGALLGYSNNTGESTGPHVHFGVGALFGKALVWFENGYRGYVDPLPFLEAYDKKVEETFPVDNRYGQSRTWRTYLSEKSFVFDLFTRKYLRRLPTNREINANSYGGWGLNDITNPAMFQVWTEWTYTEYKNVLADMIAQGKGTDLGTILEEMELRHTAEAFIHTLNNV